LGDTMGDEWLEWNEDIREDAQVYFRPTENDGYDAWMEPVVEKPHKFGLVNWTDFDTIEVIKASDYEERYGSSPYEDDDCCTFDSTALWLAVRQMNVDGGEMGYASIFPEWLPVEYRPFYAEFQYGVMDENYGFTEFPLRGPCEVKQPLGFFVLPELPYEREQYPMMDSLLKFAEQRAVKEGMPKCFFEAHYGLSDDLWRLEGEAGGQIQKVDYLPRGTGVSDYSETDALNTWIRPAVRLQFLDAEKNLLPQMETVWMFNASGWFAERSSMVVSDEVTPSWLGLMVKIFAPSDEAWESWLDTLV
jgi:hypothetical protein